MPPHYRRTAPFRFPRASAPPQAFALPLPALFVLPPPAAERFPAAFLLLPRHYGGLLLPAAFFLPRQQGGLLLPAVFFLFPHADVLRLCAVFSPAPHASFLRQAAAFPQNRRGAAPSGAYSLRARQMKGDHRFSAFAVRGRRTHLCMDPRTARFPRFSGMMSSRRVYRSIYHQRHRTSLSRCPYDRTCRVYRQVKNPTSEPSLLSCIIRFLKNVWRARIRTSEFRRLPRHSVNLSFRTYLLTVSYHSFPAQVCRDRFPRSL